MTTYRKSRAGAPAGFFAYEATGLRWLADAPGPRVVRVLHVDEAGIDLERLAPATPTAPAAHSFGSALARMHDAGAPRFGSGPPGWSGDGFFGPLEQPLPLPAGDHDRWGEFYARRRLRPVVTLLRDAGRLPEPATRAAADVVRRLEDGDWDDGDLPSRLHGDLWSGNVLWTAQGAVLIDPAAHGGHRLTDLAMLELFGLPFLTDVLAGYQEAHPLPAGWRTLVPLHQLYPVGMHAVLFGGGYVRGFADLLGACASTR